MFASGYVAKCVCVRVFHFWAGQLLELHQVLRLRLHRPTDHISPLTGCLGVDCPKTIRVAGGDMSETEVIGPGHAVGEDVVGQHDLFRHVVLVAVAAKSLEEQCNWSMLGLVQIHH